MSAVLPPEFADKNHIPLFFPAANLAANLVFDQVCSQVLDKFVWVCVMLSARFRDAFDFFVENMVANLLHQSRDVEIDAAAGSQVRWFVRARQMKCTCRKKPFRASRLTC